MRIDGRELIEKFDQLARDLSVDPDIYQYGKNDPMSLLEEYEIDPDILPDEMLDELASGFKAHPVFVGEIIRNAISRYIDEDDDNFFDWNDDIDVEY